MTDITPETEGSIDPLFVSVKEAARTLGISPWSAYQLLDVEPTVVESRYFGRRRLVVVKSLLEYAANLPTNRVDAS